MAGTRSQTVFQASGHVARTTAGQHVDVVMADTASADATPPAAVLAEAPPLLSVPAFDPLRHNPIGWLRNDDGTVGALGPLNRLPPGYRADRVVRRDDHTALQKMHHLEDVGAFHADTMTRAGTLVRLAATGVVVHLADGDRRLAPYVGAELFELMAGDVRGLDADGREALSIRMRRAALREHSLRSRARQLCTHTGTEPPPLPLVSVLLPTKRPALLPHALAGVARQTYPRLELVLGLHGDGFVGVDRHLAALPMPATVVRIDSGQCFGEGLNRMAAAAGGALLAKMDDDDAYGREHLWDMVLAHEYSQAQVIVKTMECIYLATSNVTMRWYRGRAEKYDSGAEGAGGTILVPWEVLDRIGGFPCVSHAVDLHLYEEVRGQGGRVYQTHGTGFVLVRHGKDHTWDTNEDGSSTGDDWFLDNADDVCFGWDPDQSRIGDMAASYLPLAVDRNGPLPSGRRYQKLERISEAGRGGQLLVQILHSILGPKLGGFLAEWAGLRCTAGTRGSVG